MKMAMISEEQIKQIARAMDEMQHELPHDCGDRVFKEYEAALEIIKSLNPSEPSAWMCAFKYDATDEHVVYVLDHAQDGKDYMMERLDNANNAGWRGEPIPLYSKEAK